MWFTPDKLLMVGLSTLATVVTSHPGHYDGLDARADGSGLTLAHKADLVSRAPDVQDAG